MKMPDSPTVQLEIASRYEMVDVVQGVVGQLCGMVGLDEDAAHYVNVAVRESAVNAIKHGNCLDEAKRVTVAFELGDASLEVWVRDQGAGFDPEEVPDPVAEENLLKAYGRGIFFMRSFMDEVEYSFPKQGGTLVRMLKRAQAAEPAGEAAP
jgi:serine/threonine-protein kinase RsbW